MTDRETLRALLAAATPGPWEPCSASGGRCECGFVHSAAIDGPVAITAISEETWPDWSGGTPKGRAHHNAALIAAAVNALPSLLDGLDAAERGVRHLRVVEATQAGDMRELIAERDALRAWVREAVHWLGIQKWAPEKLLANGRALIGDAAMTPE